jgi:ribosomal protein L11 methyltransferase
MMIAMQNGYVEVRLRNFPRAGELVGMLAGGNSLGSWECEDAFYLYWPKECWGVAELRDLEAALACLGTAGAIVSIKPLPEQDWNARWVASIQPIHLGERIRICQSWNSADPSFSGFELIIDPKRAFGSGYHATTQLLVEMLERHIHPASRVLDIGTGSGILSMVALRLGASSALAIDNDPDAIECARENAALNGFGEELRILAGTLDVVGNERFELLVANLDRNTILQIGGSFGCHVGAGGKALLSGLQPSDLQDVSRVVEESGGKVCRRLQRGEWIAIEVSYRSEIEVLESA